MGTLTIVAGVGAIAAAAFIAFVPTWSHPPVGGIQIGPPPTSMIEFTTGQLKEPVPQTAPAPLPPATGESQPAAQAYKNIKVLTDVSAPEFMRLQQAITQWVAPKQGCDFCHQGKDYASDANPHKLAARLMLSMVRHINADWGSHVQPAGVTCYTCHRGQPVPAETWFPSNPAPVRHFIATQENWQENGDTVRKFFPDAGWELYFLEDLPISVQSTTALPSNTVASQIVAKRVYEMMMQMSDGIGVNCGYCHNSRALESWSQSSPYRWNGYSGIKLTQDLDHNYLLQLAGLIPQDRAIINETALPVIPDREANPQRGNGLIVCATCHYARPEPLNGANMLKDYPGLTNPQPAAKSASLEQILEHAP
jgi:photosynthetic reaction center cytochrome c subunit